MKNVVCILFTVLAIASCGNDDGGTIFPADCGLMTGDVVFRRGGGLSSHAVLFADAGGQYSHVGIVVDSAGTKMIVHAVPYEQECEGEPDRVKMETPETFFNRMRATVGEVKRYRGDASVAERAAARAVEIYRRGTLFDHDYDDADTTRMYCCELVRHVFAAEGVCLADTGRHKIKLPGMKMIRCMLPSDICDSGRLRTIKSF